MSSLLSGLITMTSLVGTFVILTLAASQLSPRLISTFIADRQIQIVFGLFLGTILYVLVVLRTLDDELGKQAVPQRAVTAGSVLTVVCLFALLLYVHKVARSLIDRHPAGKAVPHTARAAPLQCPASHDFSNDMFISWEKVD